MNKHTHTTRKRRPFPKQSKGVMDVTKYAAYNAALSVPVTLVIEKQISLRKRDSTRSLSPFFVFASMYFICKLLFVAVYATVSSALPYMALFYDKIMHFSPDQIGLLLAIAPFVQSIACPFWAAVVDKKPQYHGSLMGLLCLAGGSAIMVVMYLGIITPDEKNFDFEMPSFLVLTAICVFLYAFCSGTLVSLVDSAVMKILGPNKILYGTFVWFTKY